MTETLGNRVNGWLRSKRRARIRLAGLAVLALAVVACGDDDGATDAAESEAVDVGSSSTTSTSTTPSSTTSAGSTGSETETENTASFRGVTEDTIRVGVAVPDFEALQSFGLPTYYGDYEIAYQAFFDVVNADGGIHGRQIEPYYVDFDYIRPETQDAACVELTEDHEVFIVMAGLLSGSNLCFTELHDTMLISSIFLTEELRQRSGETLWLSTTPIEEATIETLGTTVAESGQLEGKTIGIVSLGAVAGGAPGFELQDVLAEFGYDSTVAVISASTEDAVATDAEMVAITQRFIADGVDFVFSVTEGPGVYEPFAEAGYEPEIVDRSLGSSLQASPDTAVLDGVLGIGAKPNAWDDPDFEEHCSAVVLAANPQLEEEFEDQPATSEQQASGHPNWQTSVSAACNHTLLLKELGEIAGGNLSNDSFRAALDDLGPIQLYGLGQASFRSSDKWDGQDEFYLYRWNEAADEIETIEGPIFVER